MGFALSHRDLLRSPRSVALIRMLVSECLRDRDFAIQIYRDLHLPAIGRLCITPEAVAGRVTDQRVELEPRVPVRAGILDGRQPAHINRQHLARLNNLPVGWAEQRSMLGLS